MHNRKPYKLIDRKREVKKGVMAESLEELTCRGKAKLNYAIDKKVYVVLEEDGTEVDEEEYFQTLPTNTLLMLLYVGDRWSPFGPPFTNVAVGQPKHKEKRTLAASSTSASVDDEVDLSRLSQGPSFDLVTLLDRLCSDIGSIALFSGQELEVLTEFEPEELAGKYEVDFLKQIKDAADRHLEEKREIRNALGLLNLYQKSSSESKHAVTRFHQPEVSFSFF